MCCCERLSVFCMNSFYYIDDVSMGFLHKKHLQKHLMRKLRLTKQNLWTLGDILRKFCPETHKNRQKNGNFLRKRVAWPPQPKLMSLKLNKNREKSSKVLAKTFRANFMEPKVQLIEKFSQKIIKIQKKVGRNRGFFYYRR